MVTPLCMRGGRLPKRPDRCGRTGICGSHDCPRGIGPPFGMTFPLLVQAFKQLLVNFSEKHALGIEANGEWRFISFKQYYQLCRTAAKSMMMFGVTRGVSVCILGRSSPEWNISNFGAIFAGGMSVGISASARASRCRHIITNSSSAVVVVEDTKLLATILEIADDCPKVKAIVVCKGTIDDRLHRPNVLHWQEFMKCGQTISDSELDSKIAAQQPGHVCTIIYSSGTTGEPKAAMCTHDNITWTAKRVGVQFKITDADQIVSYLPPSHVANQITDIYLPLATGLTVYFASCGSGSTGRSLKDTIIAVRPTIFIGVPKFWEKVEVEIRKRIDSAGSIRRLVSRWAQGVGSEGGHALQHGRSVPYGWWLANQALFKKIRWNMGLDQCRSMFSVSAPLRKSTLEFFLSVGMAIFEVYGLTESTGPVVVTRPNSHRLGSCGQKFDGVEMKIDKPDSDGNGEVLYRSRQVFLGYLNKEESTRQAIDDDGWLHTGDIGRIDDDGFLYITGRLKDLLILAGGEKVAPAPIEMRMQQEMPLLSNVIVVGDKQRCLGVLVTLCVKQNDDGSPSDVLAESAQPILQSINSKATTVQEAMRCDEIKAYIDAGRLRVNKLATTGIERVLKFRILPADFSVMSGEMTETLKLKRRVIVADYNEQITEMYAS